MYSHDLIIKVNKICITFMYCIFQGYFGMSSTEELELAIETCKDMILLSQKDSDKQKNLVKKLVQLRLKLQELKVENCVFKNRSSLSSWSHYL